MEERCESPVDMAFQQKQMVAFCFEATICTRALFVRNRQQFFHYVSVLSFLFYLCYLIYILLPVAGPPVFFHRSGDYALPQQYQQLASTDVYPESVQRGVFYRLMGWIYRGFEAPGAAVPTSRWPAAKLFA